MTEDPETAKTESIFLTFPPLHLLQVTAVEDEATIFSNLVPQSLHWYSNMGMGGLARLLWDEFNITKSKIAFKPANCGSLKTGAKRWPEPHFLRADIKRPFGITLDSPMVID
ncbi:MAG TPA: hypothetical protein VG028_12010 [Terriglobia bacterium]|nr:hypothetical protein [Terriglobia bacterium]